MQIQNIENKISKAISVIGSVANYYNEVLEGIFDEELACLFFKNEFGKFPVKSQDLDFESISDSITLVKNKISMRLINDLKFIEEKESLKVIYNFKMMNEISSFGTIDEISAVTGLSKSSIRKAKKEGSLSEMVLPYYKEFISLQDFKEFSIKVQSIFNSGSSISAAIGVTDIDLNEFDIFIEDIYYGAYDNKKDFVRLSSKMFNKYKTKILELN
jgi:hypothetical protein